MQFKSILAKQIVVTRHSNRILSIFTVLGFCSLALHSATAYGTNANIGSKIPDYIIQYSGANIVSINSAGSIVLKIDSNSSKDIIQLTYDRLHAERGLVGGTIEIGSGVYIINRPMKFTTPVSLVMQKDTILKFAPQQHGDVAILSTFAKATIHGGVFDCNKAQQIKKYIHGLDIDVGSEGSLITEVKAMNCTTFGDGFVVKAANTTVTNSEGQYNDGDGIYLKNCDSCRVENSVFSHNAINGIDISNEDGHKHGRDLVYNNSILYNHDGINLDSTFSNNVTRNNASGNWIGISLYHSTDNNYYNTLTDNIIKNNQQWGVYEQGLIPSLNPYISGHTTISKNTIVANGHSNVIKTVGSRV